MIPFKASRQCELLSYAFLQGWVKLLNINYQPRFLRADGITLLPKIQGSSQEEEMVLLFRIGQTIINYCYGNTFMKEAN